MPAITSLDLSNAKLDVDHIAAIATSLQPTATDRLGHTKDTISGAVYKIASFTSKGVWAASTSYQVKDLVSVTVSSVTTWYVCVVQHMSSSAFASDSSSKWRIYQGVTTGDLSSVTGTSLIGVRGGQTLGDIYNVTHVATVYDDIERILDATTGPIAIRVPVGVFAAPPPEKWRDDVALIGDKVPRKSADKSRLISGSIIQGSTKFIRKQRGCLVNLGFDRGQYVCDTLFGGVYNDALVVSSWNGDPASPDVSLDGWHIDNIIALLPESDGATPASVPFHGALLEGFSASCYIGTVDGHGGIASTVLKGSNVEPKMLKGTGGNPYTVALKSNTYAKFSDVTIGQLVSIGGGGPAIISDDNTVGAPLDRLTIGQYTQRGGKFGLRTDSAGAGRTIANVSIGQVRCFGVDGNGMNIKGANTTNITITNHDFEGCGNSIYVGDNAGNVNIGEGTSRASRGRGYWIEANGVSAGEIRATDSSGAGFYITTTDFTARNVSGAANAGGLYGGTARPLTIETSDPFDVTLSDGIEVAVGGTPPKMSVSSKTRINGMSGTVSRTSSTINAGQTMVVLPPQLRPFADKLCTLVAFVSGNFSPQAVSVEAATGGVVYRGLPATIVYFSGLSFDRI